MGRKRRRASDSESLDGFGTDSETETTIEDALGHNDQVCTQCDVRNPPNADKCRKCGNANLRDKASDYRDA